MKERYYISTNPRNPFQYVGNRFIKNKKKEVHGLCSILHVPILLRFQLAFDLVALDGLLVQPHPLPLQPALDLLRTRLVVWSSANLGATWEEHAVVWPKAAGYSSLAVLPGGRLGVFYDRNNHSMAVFEAQSVSWTEIAA